MRTSCLARLAGTFGLLAPLFLVNAPDCQAAVAAPMWIRLHGRVYDFFPQETDANGVTTGHPDFERNTSLGADGMIMDAVELSHDRLTLRLNDFARHTRYDTQWREAGGLPICWAVATRNPMPGDVPGLRMDVLYPHVKMPTGFDSLAAFDQLFKDKPGVNLSQPITLTLNRTGARYDIDTDNDEPFKSKGGFYPIDGQLFGNKGAPHNYYFTMSFHLKFTYVARGPQLLRVNWNGDYWAFINSTLVLDAGGTHPSVVQVADATRLGLVNGKEYTMDLFFAQRQMGPPHLSIATNQVLVQDDDLSVNYPED